MSKIFVIPDVHLKTWMFEKTSEILLFRYGKEYKGQFNVRIPSKLHRMAVISARKKNISLNDFVRTAIEDECSKSIMEA
ncbi:toxin-antitoxin system HicB family antitoxin [Oribacterium sp. FC2011]|uniref:toxin-antitoxin system HicB family antitoxin n=1 Tax=Oribacterium sp. FC2011 TaxID=1408311 RepID=UPI0004E0FEF2|nr:toxin-antitoxin system HicB family antitoxin [Oribacterium sp. FC2011]